MEIYKTPVRKQALRAALAAARGSAHGELPVPHAHGIYKRALARFMRENARAEREVSR